ncbi:MAG: S1 RNA-binding domain-containing protein [Lactobacillaceae bacterium]|jgi:general stress protein 13|nr:S1 RNA-binding domain-containing protein [Lactobacillaceae bacterium]
MDYHIGQILTGKISGIQDYGVFVSLDSKTQGLIHISECASGKVTDIYDDFQIGDEIEVIILDIDSLTNDISLSFRQVDIPMPKATDIIDKNKKVKRENKHFWTNSRLNIGFKTVNDNLSRQKSEAQSRID